jgi:putative transcription factor
MICEMCGKEVDVTSRVRVEGSVLRLCGDCAHFGELLDPPGVGAIAGSGGGRGGPVVTATRPQGATRRLEERDLYTDIGELELAPDWPKRVRVAREGLGWTPEVLGKKLNEKKSVILKIESGNFHPPDALVRKMEHLLKVRLRADPESMPSG